MNRTRLAMAVGASAQDQTAACHKWRRRIYALAAVAFTAALIWCLTIYSMIMRFDGKPAGSLPEHADVGIVLGATLWDNAPSPGLKERLDLALKLYKLGVFPHLIVTGGLDSNGATLTEAEGMRDYLTENGVPEAAIALDVKARSTYENLLFSKAIMEREGWRTAVIVTHRYHGSRALDIAETLGYKQVQVCVTESHVLNMPFHETREVLAYTKWLGQKWLLHDA